MKPRAIILVSVFTLFCAIRLVTLAQDTCPAIVQTALAVANRACQATGRNQACYGNIHLEAVPQPDASGFKSRALKSLVRKR